MKNRGRVGGENDDVGLEWLNLRYVFIHTTQIGKEGYALVLLGKSGGGGCAPRAEARARALSL